MLTVFLFASQAFGSSCNESLSTSKAFQRIEQLNAELLKNAPIPLSKTDALIILKNEIWRLLPNGGIPWKNKAILDEELTNHLKNQFNKNYRMDEMNSDDLYLFYANQLNSIYLLLLREWIEEEIIDSKNITTPFLKNFAFAVMSRSLASPLLSSTFNPEMTEGILNAKEWENFPWSEALKIASDSKEQKELTWEGIQRASHRSAIENALRNPGFANPCCLTDPGCLLCPNNRSWLRR